MNGWQQVITEVEFNRKAAPQGEHHVIQATTSEGLAQVGFEPATFRTDPNTEPPRRIDCLADEVVDMHGRIL